MMPPRTSTFEARGSFVEQGPITEFAIIARRISRPDKCMIQDRVHGAPMHVARILFLPVEILNCRIIAKGVHGDHHHG